jgi:hypothetical protein
MRFFVRILDLGVLAFGYAAIIFMFLVWVTGVDAVTLLERQRPWISLWGFAAVGLTAWARRGS